MTNEKDYVLGTHDDEIARLDLQHRVWRARAQDAWKRAGFAAGNTLLDVGCGPGFASLDLAEVVGPRGRVVGIDRSRRFLGALEAARDARGLTQIETVEHDLAEPTFPALTADGAWARWVFAFVPEPRALLARVALALRPGAPFVIHEYFDYRTWRLAPPAPAIEEFVRAVMASWRERGGEPDVGLDLPRWLEELGFAVKSLRPIVDCVSPSSVEWQWLASFLVTGTPRLVEIGAMDQARADAVHAALAASEAAPHTRMVTPALMEIVAVKK